MIPRAKPSVLVLATRSPSWWRIPIYHSGQVTVERKAGDVTFLAAYTLAKAIDDSSAFGELINFQNAKLSRGLSSTDVHQNFVVSYVWEMPFHRLFHGMPRLTKGWQLQGITRFAGGFPVQMGEGNPVGNQLCAQLGPVTGRPVPGRCLACRQPVHRYAQSRGSSSQI